MRDARDEVRGSDIAVASKLHAARLEELKEIADSNDGVLECQAVVERARDKKSALHSWFEWDDEKAGEAYRLQQARQLVRIYVDVLHHDSSPVRVFMSLTTDRKTEAGGYRLTIDVLQDHEMRSQLLADAKRDFDTWRRKYAHLKELAAVFEAVDGTWPKSAEPTEAK